MLKGGLNKLIVTHFDLWFSSKSEKNLKKAFEDFWKMAKRIHFILFLQIFVNSLSSNCPRFPSTRTEILQAPLVFHYLSESIRIRRKSVTSFWSCHMYSFRTMKVLSKIINIWHSVKKFAIFNYSRWDFRKNNQ